MTARKTPTPDADTPDAGAEYAARVEALHVAFVNAPRQSDAARVVHINGKSLRDGTRKAGHYVSHGAVWPNGRFAPDDDADTRTIAEARWDMADVQRAVVALLGAPPA